MRLSGNVLLGASVSCLLLAILKIVIFGKACHTEFNVIESSQFRRIRLSPSLRRTKSGRPLGKAYLEATKSDDSSAISLIQAYECRRC